MLQLSQYDYQHCISNFLNDPHHITLNYNFKDFPQIHVTEHATNPKPSDCERHSSKLRLGGREGGMEEV